ncbi:MAG: hypothetical protein ACRDXX_15790, partial [Stackebrandtia sp.]
TGDGASRGVASVPSAQQLSAADLPPQLPQSQGRVYGGQQSAADEPPASGDGPGAWPPPRQ